MTSYVYWNIQMWKLSIAYASFTIMRNTIIIEISQAEVISPLILLTIHQLYRDAEMNGLECHSLMYICHKVLNKQ